MPSDSTLTLVIDDDELSRELLAVMLEAAGYPAQAFASGEAALDALRSGAAAPAPGFVVSDLQMPGLTGNALAGELRALLPEATLLAISARQPAAEAVSGFDGFLLKPFSAEQLAAALAAPQKPAPAAGETASAADAEASVLDQETYRKLAAGMKPEQLRQFYQFTLEDAGRRAELLRAAAEAGDETTFVREAHSLQGGCGLIGALELRGIARRMENQGLSAAALVAEIPAAVGRLQRMLEALFELQPS